MMMTRGHMMMMMMMMATTVVVGAQALITDHTDHDNNYLPHLFNELPDYWGAKANVADR